MSGTRALIAGLRRALLSPHLVVLILLLTAAAAAPAAWILRGSIQKSIGSRLAAGPMLESFDAQWFDEWRAGDEGINRTFGPELSGPGFAWRNLESWLDGGWGSLPPSLLVLGALHALVWLFLLGGILDGWARPDVRRGPIGFLRACARFWPRLIRLGLCSLAPYVVIYLLHVQLVERLEDATRDLARELPAIFQMLALYALTAVLLMSVNLWFTVAKVVVIADDRRGVLRALGRAALFSVRRAPSVIGLYGAVVCASAVLFVIWNLVAPGASPSTPTAIALAFAAGQAYLAARVMLRLGLYAGTVELYRASAPPEPALDAPAEDPVPTSDS